MDSMSIPVDSTTILAGSAVVAIVISIAGSFITALWQTINWLRDKFNEVENHLEQLLDTHEQKDTERHEDNVRRFAVIETQLKTIIKNGNGKH